VSRRGGWRNWGGNQRANPIAVDEPRSLLEVVEAVEGARRAGQTMKVVASGHSFSDVACTSGRLMRVDALDRLTAVLALNREAGDLGRLVSDEARNIRRDAHRQLVETIERRAQTVWIPVTVATLVPGALFLAVPFTDALRLFSQQ
jgi:FAD/FMN-containing dehydrogenase